MCAAIVICLPASVLAQRLPLKTYTTTDGLARDYVNRIVLDSHAFLWFCTPEGLSRFDGYDFLNYGAGQGLQGSVRDLLEAHDGVYWIATASGLYRFDPGDVGQGSTPAASSRWPRFTPFYPGPSKRARSVNVIKEDRSNAIWLGTDDGLYRLNEGNFSPTEIGLPQNDDDRTVMTILFDHAGSTWIGTTSGLYRLVIGDARRYTVKDGLPANDVRALLEDRAGRLWIGTTQGLVRLNPKSNSSQLGIEQTYTSRNGLTHDWVTSLLQTTDGRLWIGTNRGLNEFAPGLNGSAFRSYTNGEGLTTNEIQSLAEDSEGELWIGTESGGAMKLVRSGFTSYAKADGLANTRIASIFEDAAGELCVLSNHSGQLFIHRFDGTRFFAIKPGLSDRLNYGWGWNQLALQDSTGEWWLPTGQGLYRFPRLETIAQLSRARPRNVYTTKDGLPGDALFRLYEDKSGNIWIGSINPNRGALGRWERDTGKFQVYSTADGVPQFMAPTAFREDRNGKLWIGFYDGTLARYDEGHFTSFGAGVLPEGIIRDLFVDHAGSLWVATNRGGIVRVDGLSSTHPHFVSFTTAQGLASNQATCLTEDQQGRMYIGTANGIDRLDPATGHVKHYTTADGLVNNFVNVAYRDRQGMLWFGTLQGISRLLPESRSDPTNPPSIFINGLRIAGEAYSLSHLGQKEINGPELSANQNDLQIDFSSISVGSADSLRYEYKLEGADREWSAPTRQRSITYARLSPGTYRFLVRAINDDDLASAQPASVSFKILRPLWQRWWFLSLAGLFVVGVAYLMHRYRVNRLLELERVRTRIATDLHDDIGSSLSQIAILSEVVRQNAGQASPRVNEPLSRITTSSSELMGTMSDIVWAIDPHKDRLADLTQRMRRFASDVLTARCIDFEFQAPDIRRKLNLGADVRRQVFLVFKESINNVVRHSACSHVVIDFRVDRDLLILLIKDDGRGFDPAHDSDGHGLASMKGRAKETGGRIEINSRPGEGTSVTLEMPIRGRSKLSFSPNGR
jgi:ligand-binding sensor domain-containing protein/signal transduction histidine kinase